MNEMSARERHQRRMQQNGLLAVFIGLVGGFVLVASLIGGISASPFPLFVSLHVPGTSSGWLSFHLGMLMNGMMALLLERTLINRAVSSLKSAMICWGVIIAVWGNGAFYLFSMFASNRGLTSDANVFGPQPVWLPCLLPGNRRCDWADTGDIVAADGTTKVCFER